MINGDDSIIRYHPHFSPLPAPPRIRRPCRIDGISDRVSLPGDPATMPPPPPVERKPSYIQFTPKRSLPSFENLVALANYEERLKGARKIVWRDRGELPVEIHDLWECLKHATKGGLSELNPTLSLPASKSHSNQPRGRFSRIRDTCRSESYLALDEVKTNQ